MRNISNHLPALHKFLTIAAVSVLLGAITTTRPTTSAPMALTSTEEVASLRGSGPGYTRHDPLAQQAEILAIRLGAGFEIGEDPPRRQRMEPCAERLGPPRDRWVAGRCHADAAGTGSPFGRTWTIAPCAAAHRPAAS